MLDETKETIKNIPLLNNFKKITIKLAKILHFKIQNSFRMSQIVMGIYNLGSSVCHAVAYALLRDLTNYYWSEERAEFEKQQELQTLIQESLTETNKFVSEVTGEFPETNESSLILSLKKSSSKDTISTNESTPQSEIIAISKPCTLCLENPSDDSDHCDDCDESFNGSITSGNRKTVLSNCLLEGNESDHPDHRYSEGLFKRDKNNETCDDSVDSLAFTLTNYNRSNTISSKNTVVVECDLLRETGSKEGSIIVMKDPGLEINDQCCDKYNLETFTTTDIEVQKPDTNPKSTKSTYDLEENTEEGSVIERSRLGIIETFSDVGSVCFDDKFLQGLISEKPLECTKEESGTRIESSADINQKSKADCCLHAIFFDAGDDMRNDLLSEKQLHTIETGSVNDWLYSVTSSPAICLLRSDEFLTVTQEEIESIQEQEKMHEICKATDEIMLKQSYVNQWLIDTKEYVCTKQLFGDGDFM